MYAQTLTKIISLSDKAYKALKKRKGKGESFSDVVARITQEKQSKSVLSFAGAWIGTDANKVAERVRREREVIVSREYAL